MALDEPRDEDYSYEKDGFTFVVSRDLMDKAQPLTVDFTPMGFKISAGIDFGAGGCGGCGTSNSCG